LEIRVRTNLAWYVGLFLLASASGGKQLTAQESPFSAANLRRHVETMAHDSMQGRATPSPGLERAVDYVAGQFAVMGLDPWGETTTFRMRYPIPGNTANDSSANVVAILRGRDAALRSEFVVITAHLDGLGVIPKAPQGSDSVLNGADDNASGVAALLEIARTLASSREQTRRSILIAAVTGEEPGLWGSDYLVSQFLLQGSRVVANLNMDMVGRARGDSVFLVTTRDRRTERIVSAVRQERADWGLHLLGRETLEQQYPGESLEERSDHANFVRRGIPAVALFTGLHEDYHGRGDDPDKINYDALARIARMAHDIAVALANGRD
jgi:Zn-dependent M28 family amino/carboxypeptidase